MKVAATKYVPASPQPFYNRKHVMDERRKIQISIDSLIDQIDLLNARLIVLEQPIIFTAPTLLNSWVNFGSPFETAGYSKDQHGLVRLKGVVKSGASSIIFTLPTGYRPTNRLVFATITGGDIVARLDIDPDGSVVQQSGNNSYYCLNSAFFVAGA